MSEETRVLIRNIKTINNWSCYLIHVSDELYDSGFTLLRKDTYCKDKDFFVFMFQNFVI